MTGFVIRRIGAALIVGLALIAVVFILQETSDFDPVRAKLGPNATNEIVEAERERLGYDDPLPARYASYVEDVAQGDLGISLRTNQPVAEDIREFAPASLELMLLATLLGLPIAFLLAIASAARWRGAGLFRFLVLSASSAPSFLLALLGILLFFKTLTYCRQAAESTSLILPTVPPTSCSSTGRLPAAPQSYGTRLTTRSCPLSQSLSLQRPQ